MSALARFFSKLFWICLALLAIGLSIGTVSESLADRYWIFELATHFQLQYAILLAAIGLVFALDLRWRWALLCWFVGGGAFCFHILPLYVSPSTSNRELNRTLRLVSSNIASFNETKEQLIQFIAPEDPDVILLFEVSADWLETLKPLEDIYPYRVVRPHAVHSGIAIYSRFPFEESDLKIVGDPSSPMLVRTLQVNGGTLTVVGVHPKSPISWASTLARNEELIELAELVVTLPQPLVVAGDLNTSSWNPAFKRLVNDTGLRDSRQGFGVQLSWPSFVPLLRTTIDHCLVSPRVRVLNRRVGPNIGSDHFPIVVDLQVDLPEK